MESDITDCAIFSACFLDDAQWTEEGNLMTPGGWAIATYLAEQLVKRGLEAKLPIQHSYYAWLIEVQCGKAVVRCYLQDLQPWLLISEAKGSLFGRKAKEELHARVVAGLEEAVRSDRRFFDVRWETMDKLQAEGKVKG